jgi:tetratricopeptide (TPR) repeat protein
VGWAPGSGMSSPCGDVAPHVVGRHTEQVRLRIALVLSIYCATAQAEMIRAPQAPPVDPDRGNFWREIAEPHKDEVQLIVFKARQAMAQGDVTLLADYDPTGEGRQKLYRELFGMLRYARRLAPDNLDVLKLYAQSADAIGKTRQAMDALHAVIDLVGPEKAGPEVTGRLGEIYLRLGQLDDAIRYLREAQGPIQPGQPITAHNLVHLSTALAMRGQLSDAIDVLADALPTSVPYYANEYQVVTFALAVAYDRDDQRSLAVEQLDHLRAALQESWGQSVHTALATLRFAPAEDQQYYQALLLEATDNYSDARAGWALYAAARGAYSQRALDHITAIDTRPRSAKSALIPALAPIYPPTMRHRRRHP